MKKRSIYVLIATILTVLVPAPGRFVYGVALVLEINIIMLIGTLVNSLVKKIKLEELNTLIILIMIISSTILYRQIMIMICPEVMLTLGVLIYLTPISVFCFGLSFNIVPIAIPAAKGINGIIVFSPFTSVFFASYIYLPPSVSKLALFHIKIH